MSSPYLNKIELYEGDFGKAVHFKCTDKYDKTPFDLSGYTVKLRFAIKGKSTSHLIVDATIDSNPDGTIHYDLVSGDLDIDDSDFNDDGECEMDVQAIAVKAGYEETFGGLTLIVKEKLPSTEG